MQLTNEEGGAHILEPICILVSPHKSTIENRRFLRDDHLWFSKPEEPPFYCRVCHVQYFWVYTCASRTQPAPMVPVRSTIGLVLRLISQVV